MPIQPTRLTLLGRLHDASDDSAWLEFESQYRELIARYCQRKGLQPSDADDVVQVVLTSLTTLFRRGFRHDPAKGRFRSYLGRVVQNAIARWRKAGGDSVQRLSTAVADSVPQEREDADAAWQEEWESHHMRRAMRSVRATFEPSSLQVFEALLRGGTVDDVAQQFGMKADAVYKVRTRVRERVRELIAAQVEAEERLVH